MSVGHLNWKQRFGNADPYNKMSCTIKVKSSRYRPGVAQRVGRGIALLFLDHGTIGG